MPLDHYGVAIGDVIRFSRDPRDQYGRWYHGHLEISTPGGTWTSALDVDTPTGLGIRYRTSSGLAPSVLGPVTGMALGFHQLAPSANGGAIDYVRSAFLQDRALFLRRAAILGMPRIPVPIPPPLPDPVPMLPPGGIPIPRPEPPEPDSPKEVLLRWLLPLNRIGLVRVLFNMRPWIKSDGDNALSALEQHLAPGRRAFIFGERYTTGDGVHDVHQNQGDPAGSQWWGKNGIWQDGAVGVIQPDGKLYFWQVRFESQATSTDANGHPL